MIPVTKSFFPDVEVYKKYIDNIWENKWLTNRGELILSLEEKIKKYLAIDNIVITNNGTIPLQIALKLLGNNGEIITTPFSYVATSAAIVWENCKPIFVDIHPHYLTIDESKIEKFITPNTTAILATHVFGNPCNVEAIEKIATKHSLKVIYDAAHCFGVKYNGNSIFEYGDISTCSFHATKLFHTGEGGAMFSKNKDLQHKMFYSHNFGHNGPLDFHGLGINGKISELQAAMGLSVFDSIDFIISERKRVVDYYNNSLNFSNFRTLMIRENTHWNYSYYPIIFESEDELLRVVKILNENQIYPRRYFYPSLNTIKYNDGKEMPVSESISSRIVCLPLYVGLTNKELENIVSLINKNIC